MAYTFDGLGRHQEKQLWESTNIVLVGRTKFYVDFSSDIFDLDIAP
jgi:hypothetical protein